MPEGPFGGPRPFASPETIKIMMKVDKFDRGDKVQFDSIMQNSDNITQPPESRIVRSGDTVTVVLDTRQKNIRLRRIRELETDMIDAIQGAGSSKVGDTVRVVTPKQ